MSEVRQTNEFQNWLRRLDDQNAYARIVARIRRMEHGNPGDTKSIGAGVMEMRIDYGPGYRVLFHSARQDHRDSAVRRRQTNAETGHQTSA